MDTTNITPQKVQRACLEDYTTYLSDHGHLTFEKGYEVLQQYLKEKGMDDSIGHTRPLSEQTEKSDAKRLCQGLSCRSGHLGSMETPNAFSGSDLLDPRLEMHGRVNYTANSSTPAGSSEIANPPYILPSAVNRRPLMHPQELAHTTYPLPTVFGPLAVTGQPNLPLPIGGANIESIDDYDPLWVQRTGTDPDTIKASKSGNMSLETLYYSNVLRMGDNLVIPIKCNIDDQEHDIDAQLTITGQSHDDLYGKRLPDMTVVIAGFPQLRVPDVKACSRPKAIFTHLMEHLNEHQITIASSGRGFWHGIRVIRHGQDLGSLHWLRAAFTVWRDQKDQEATQTGQYLRKRLVKGSRTSAAVVQSGGRLQNAGASEVSQARAD